MGSALSRASKRKPKHGRHQDDENQATSTPSLTRFGSSHGRISRPLHRRADGSYILHGADPLTTFRLMLGITATPQLGFRSIDPVESRPADNIGLYARVVQSEYKANHSYKIFSAVINVCYFLQIIIAAALTAMGAANVDNKAITFFGAVNTVIAGFLTFLKGSGLPGRLKYYGNEWKKIREYIEQRERDFSRGDGCGLDVYEVVLIVESMYANTKLDIEMNTPDSYMSISRSQRQLTNNDAKIGGIDVSKLETMSNKSTSVRDLSAHTGIGNRAPVRQSSEGHEGERRSFEGPRDDSAARRSHESNEIRIEVTKDGGTSEKSQGERSDIVGIANQALISVRNLGEEVKSQVQVGAKEFK